MSENYYTDPFYDIQQSIYAECLPEWEPDDLPSPSDLAHEDFTPPTDLDFGKHFVKSRGNVMEEDLNGFDLP